MAYALSTYRDGSRALTRMTPAQIRKANELAHIPPRPIVRQLTKREARAVYLEGPDVTEPCIAEEFSAEGLA